LVHTQHTEPLSRIKVVVLLGHGFSNPRGVEPLSLISLYTLMLVIEYREALSYKA
jgi:hypothetical protein